MEKKRILIDTTDESASKEYIKTLSSELQRFGCSIQEILITHWHHDHVGAVQSVVKQIKDESGSSLPIKVSKCRLPLDTDEHKEVDQAWDYNFVQDDHVFETEGATLKAIFTPGHAKDHLCFYLPEEDSLFSGDNVLGETSAHFEDLYSYMSSLRRILELKPRTIYPAHGPVIKNGTEGIQRYIEHRQKRNQQILDCLRNSPNSSSLSVEELVASIYAGLDVKYIPAASSNVSNHLKYLVADGKIEQEEGSKEAWKLKNEKINSVL